MKLRCVIHTRELFYSYECYDYRKVDKRNTKFLFINNNVPKTYITYLDLDNIIFYELG